MNVPTPPVPSRSSKNKSLSHEGVELSLACADGRVQGVESNVGVRVVVERSYRGLRKEHVIMTSQHKISRTSA